jgi:hypothetical protein
MKVGKIIFGLKVVGSKKIKANLQAVPKSHLKKLRGIYVHLLGTAPLLWYIAGPNEPFFVGMHNNITRNILLSDEGDTETLYHEIGHHVWRRILPEFLKGEFVQTHADLRTKKQNEESVPWFLDYCQTSEEFFTDCYSAAYDKIARRSISMPQKVEDLIQKVMQINSPSGQRIGKLINFTRVFSERKNST